MTTTDWEAYFPDCKLERRPSLQCLIVQPHKPSSVVDSAGKSEFVLLRKQRFTVLRGDNVVLHAYLDAAYFNGLILTDSLAKMGITITRLTNTGFGPISFQCSVKNAEHLLLAGGIVLPANGVCDVFTTVKRVVLSGVSSDFDLAQFLSHLKDNVKLPVNAEAIIKHRDTKFGPNHVDLIVTETVTAKALLEMPPQSYKTWTVTASEQPPLVEPAAPSAPKSSTPASAPASTTTVNRLQKAADEAAKDTKSAAPVAIAAPAAAEKAPTAVVRPSPVKDQQPAATIKEPVAASATKESAALSTKALTKPVGRQADSRGKSALKRGSGGKSTRLDPRSDPRSEPRLYRNDDRSGRHHRSPSPANRRRPSSSREHGRAPPGPDMDGGFDWPPRHQGLPVVYTPGPGMMYPDYPMAQFPAPLPAYGFGVPQYDVCVSRLFPMAFSLTAYHFLRSPPTIPSDRATEGTDADY